MPLAFMAGAVLGVAIGGRWSNLGRVRLRGWGLVFLALGAELGAGALPVAGRLVVALGSGAAVVAWCVLNRRQRSFLPGLAALGSGVVANVAVMAANGGMPVSARALRAAGAPAALDVARGHLYKHVPLTHGTVLRFLGDVIPVRAFHMVMSAGDVVMLVGILLVAWAGTRPSPRTARTRQSGVLSSSTCA